MSRERLLEHRLRTLGTLEDAIGALRSLSAHHFRAARAPLQGIRAYRDEVRRFLAVLEPAPREPRDQGRTGIVLVAADLGLAGDYNVRLVREALALREESGPGPLLCLGRRAEKLLERERVRPDSVQPAPASVGALPNLLLPLVDTLLSLRASGELEGLWLVAARFEGAGHYSPVRVPLLPIERPPEEAPLPISRYCDREHLRAVVVREYLYAALYETLLDALASEHGKRLITTESARSWLQDQIAATRRMSAAVRRESATREVLEVVAAARSARRSGGLGER
jgi:F-type H+-transporting ATPase subunit gamma